MNKKKYLALVLILLLLIPGAVNIYKKLTWKEPTDGVVWKEGPEGLTAMKVDVGGPAYFVGIKKGNILVSINNIPIKNKIDVAKTLWMAWGTDQKVTYQIKREGELIFPSFYLSEKGAHLIYYYLALIGLTTLILGIIIFFNSKKPFSLPYIFFFLLTLVFYSFYVFSPTGELDTLDSLFYWLDKVAFLVFPPLLLHYFLIFPVRKKVLKNNPSLVYFLYLPGFVLLLTRILLHVSLISPESDSFQLKATALSEKFDLIHFALFSIITLAIISYDTVRSPNLILKKQLRWIVYGLSLGILPFTALYIIPFVAGQIPSPIGELSIVFQALIPLTFSYSISRHKLMNLEVILKKAVTLITSYVVIAILYFIVSSRTKIFSENRPNALILGILAILLGATLFSPLKSLIQSLLDRAIYRRSYKYRRTLLSITQEISRERNLQKLSQSLLEQIANALSLEDIALLLHSDKKKTSFSILESRGKLPGPKTTIHLEAGLYRHLMKEEYLSSFLFSEKKELHREFQSLISMGFFHLLPLKVEEKIIGCLGMGKKVDNSFLTSEDWELLRTISSPVALALENAYLYEQANIRAKELERLKDYSENIIESLTVGVAVLDQKGRIIGWNRVLEGIFAKNEGEVRGKRLIQVLGEKNFKALYPPDTQEGFRLMSEISLDMPSGGEKIFDIAKTPLLDNRMNPYGTVIVFEDITEKISLQQQLLTSEKLASIGLLSAGVAHEINTPLTGISSYVQILQKKLSDSIHSDILGKIESQTERVARIVKNLLNFARNPSETSFHSVSLKKSIEEIISLIDYKLKNMKIDLELNMQPTAPVWIQEERVQQVLINIILNAIDAMPNGGKLTIELIQTDSHAKITIADTGMGIKDQHLPHIFDPFFTTKGLGKGTGLGLSISYAIIKEHGGNITVDSKAGEGTLFTINIPVNPNKEQMNKTSPS